MVVSNVSVTCRSSDIRVERQLPDLTNSHCRPEAEVENTTKQTFNVEISGGKLALSAVLVTAELSYGGDN